MPDTSQRPLPAPVRLLLAAFAVLCIALGVVGIFVPGMPTTVFIIMAAWAAARSSPRLHAWLMGHRLFGPLLRNWQNGGRMSRRAKWSATAAMAFCALILLATTQRVWAASLALACMDGVLAWLWCRPEPA
ncbi:YbaN family protein [Xylophilus sp. GW821-FHT01B05]